MLMERNETVCVECKVPTMVFERTTLTILPLYK